jgi:hypothetical protein
MTSEEVTEFFAPAQSSVNAVIDWLVSSGIAPNRISQSVNKQGSSKLYHLECLSKPKLDLHKIYSLIEMH